MKAAALSIEDSRLKISVVSKGRFSLSRPAKELQPEAEEEASLPLADEERTKALKDALEKLRTEHGVGAALIGLDFKQFSHHFIELPVKKKEDIRRALAFELEKYLPLQPDEYIYDFHTVKTTKDGTLNLVLSIRKDKLKWIAGSLKESGIRPLGVRCTLIEAMNGLVSEGAMELSDEGLREMFRTPPARLNGLAISGKRAIALDFTPPEIVPEKADYYPYAIGVMSAAALSIFFLTSVFSYYKDYSALRSVEERIERIKGASGEIAEGKKTFEAMEAERRFLLDFRDNKNANILLLKHLSAVLPADAWLVRFSADETGKVQIEGYARRAADIIAPLERSPLLRNVEFSAPVAVEGERERFSLRMEVER